MTAGDNSLPVLVTGATGYIGGRLIPRLLQSGVKVRALARDPSRLQGRSWRKEIEVRAGDVLDPDSIRAALEGTSAAYYLIHSMHSGESFHQRDIEAATLFGKAAVDARVERIVYLGGLGDPAADLSDHLRSRQLTGAALREGGVPVLEYRAGIVVGSGSISFEMIRYLTERIPVMVAPRWVQTRIQPIAIDDVMAYLLAAVHRPRAYEGVIEIGGASVLTYGEMMLEYARVRGLRRFIILVPVLTPRLSSYWIHWMTPIPAAIARPLIEGLRNEVVVRDPRAVQVFPDIRPMSYAKAVELALRNLRAGKVETAWSDAQVSSRPIQKPAILTTKEGMILERRHAAVRAPASNVFDVFASLGGERGWLFATWLWRLRGNLDRLLGGVGFRRGRRDPIELRTGDAVDFWRVEEVEAGASLRLRAEMKLPGSAWLEFNVSDMEDRMSLLKQTAYFAPKGLGGFLYWYLLYPIHSLIFSQLLRRIAATAENEVSFHGS